MSSSDTSSSTEKSSKLVEKFLKYVLLYYSQISILVNRQKKYFSNKIKFRNSKNVIQTLQITLFVLKKCISVTLNQKTLNCSRKRKKSMKYMLIEIKQKLRVNKIVKQQNRDLPVVQ